MSYQRTSTPRRPGPLRPLVGLIVLLGVGAGAYFAAPALVDWLETTHFEIAGLGWQILPYSFPEEWPDALTHALVGVFAFLIGFSILMLVLFMVMRPPRDELDVPVGRLREQKKKQKRR